MKVIKGLVLLCLMMLAGCQSEEETSQFLLACKYDAPATIAAMLDNGIDVDGQDKTGKRPDGRCCGKSTRCG